MRYKQRVFVAEYLKDFNATRAAIAAGYSERTAFSIGWENLRKPEIKEAIESQIMSRDEAMLGITDIARGNIADLMEVAPNGFTLQLMVKDEATKEMVVNPKTKLIKKIRQKVTRYTSKKDDEEERETVETELELYSAHDALRDIAKFHGATLDAPPVVLIWDVTKPE